MAAVSAGIAIAGMGMSAIQANQQKKQADAAQRAQQEQLEKQQEFAERQYQEEKAIFGPIKERIARDVMADTPSDYGKISGEISKRFGQARTSMPMMGMGSGGLQLARMHGFDMAEATAKSSAYGDALARQEASRLGFLNKDNTFAAGQGVSNAYGNMASMYGDRAKQAREMEAQSWKSFGGAAETFGGEMDGIIGGYGGGGGSSSINKASNTSSTNKAANTSSTNKKG